MSWNPDTIKETLIAFRQRAAHDEAFRRVALDNPKQAFKMLTGKELPEHFHLRTVENAGAHLTIVLPDVVAQR